MDSATDSTRQRSFLLCRLCRKPQPRLSGHLRKMCMLGSPEDDIQKAVLDAKNEVAEWMRRGRMWDARLVQNIIAGPNPFDMLVREMELRGNIVFGLLPTNPATAAPVMSTSATTAPATAAPATEEPATEHESCSGDSVGSGELYQSKVTQVISTQVRKNMADKGLYKKHSLDHPLLNSFAKYLEVDLNNANYKQEVENVARLMYFMDPTEVSLNFTKDFDKSRDYFNKLTEANLSKQTVQNYLKSVKRFLRFHTGSTNLALTDRDLHEACKNYILFVSNLQTVNSKHVSKELVRKRHKILQQEEISTNDCLAVLFAAKMDFLSVLGKLCGPDKMSGSQLTLNDCQTVLYYLQAVLILKHLQRPGVVENMTVGEWLIRTTEGEYCVIGVKEHKTSTTKVAAFALTQEEEMWFDLYFKSIRPVLMKGSRKRKRVGKDVADSDDSANSDERFFVSSSGKAIYNPSNDLRRLHIKYNVPNVTSQTARRVFETATKPLSEVKKSQVADYLSHSSATAEKHYRMMVSKNVPSGAKVIESLLGVSNSGQCVPGESGLRAAPKLTEKAAYELLVKAYPVTLDGVPPIRSARTSLVKEHQRYSYDRWRSDQRTERERHVLEHFGRRLPTEARVKSWMKKQGWLVNLPDSALIVKHWKPPGPVDAALSSLIIQKAISKQRWKGLVVTDIDGKGKGVVTTRPFLTGEVVCDYHGNIITREEGLIIHGATKDIETGYMFFFKDSTEKRMCIDAHAENCACHPGRTTVGRHINHSSKKANLRPRLFHRADICRDVIVFFANKDIKVGEEVLFDYGVHKKSFAGEGLDLDWL